MHRSFKARQGAEAITFDFEGEVFRCVPYLDVDMLATVAQVMLGAQESVSIPTDLTDLTPKQLESLKAQAGMMLQVRPFFESVLVEDDATDTQGSSLDRFREVLKRKANRMDIETVTDIMLWLVEVYTGRPTLRPGVSAPGPSSTTSNLRAISSPPAIPQTSEEEDGYSGAI